jgi:hypothetical protein
MSRVAPVRTLNPHAELVLSREGDSVVAITVEAPIRGRSLQVTTFSRAQEPRIFDLLRRIAEKRGGVSAELDEAEHARLSSAGLVIPKGRVPRHVRFRCSPVDPPRELVARRAAVRSDRPARAGKERGRLRVNPSLRFQDDRRPPDDAWTPKKSTARRAQRLRGDLINPFAGDCAWAWVDHPDAAVPSALSVSEADRELFRGLVPGAAAPKGLNPRIAKALAAADVLIDPPDEERRRASFDRARAEAAEGLLRDRYAALRGMLAPIYLAGIRRYYRELVAEGHVCLGDDQVSRRYRAHNEPLARVIHKDLAPLVSELAGEAMIPSYVYFASYRAGSALKPHTDRPECALSISLLIDYTPEPTGASPWPLYLTDAKLSRARARARERPPPFAAELGLGDGLVYRGTELTHWRDALPKGHTSTSLFFHYVPAGWSGSLD